MRNQEERKDAVGKTSNTNDREVSSPGFHPCLKEKSVEALETSNTDDHREVFPPPGFCLYHKEERETSNKGDRTEVSPLNNNDDDDDDDDVSPPPGFLDPLIHKRKRDATSEAISEDDHGEFSPPLGFSNPHDHKGKKVVTTWETSYADDSLIVSPPPPGFLPHKMPHSMTEIDKWNQEVCNDAESIAISLSIGGEKTKSDPVIPSPPNVVTINTERSEDITENENESSPRIMIPSKGKEKVTQVLPVIDPIPTQESVKQNIDVPQTSTNSLYSIPSKMASHHPSTSMQPSAPFGGSAESNNLLKTLEGFYPHRTANSLALISSLLRQGFGYSNPRANFIFARQRLSLLLPINVFVLADPVKSKEIVDLSAILQRDSSLSANQVAMLKLITEEIPSLSKEVIHIRDLGRRVRYLLGELKSNCFKVIHLCQKYTESKDKLRTLQAEVDADAAAIQELGNEIEAPSARHSILVCSLEMKKKTMVEVESSLEDIQAKINNVLSGIISGFTKREEREEKRKFLTDLLNKIDAKLALLKDFTI